MYIVYRNPHRHIMRPHLRFIPPNEAPPYAHTLAICLYVFLQLKKLHNEMPLANQALADFNDDALRDLVSIGEKVLYNISSIHKRRHSM